MEEKNNLTKTRIVFTGDLSFSGYFAEAWKRDDCLDNEVREYLNASDEVVVNLECPLTKAPIDSVRTFNHAGTPEAGTFLKNNGIRVWSIANNHIMDCLETGLADTIACAGQQACTAIGAGMTLEEAADTTVIGTDVRVGVLAVANPWYYLIAEEQTPGVLTWDKKSVIKEQIRELKERADWVVVVTHGGDEYCDVVLPHIRKRYHEFLAMGADIVVGHHPHVVQNYERVDNKIIFYSLGNFMFDTDNQRMYPHTDTGMLLGIEFYKERFVFDTLPVRIDREQTIVVPGAAPVVFRDISGEEYRRLWPVSAHYFFKKDWRNRTRNHRRMQNKSRLWLFAYEVYTCRHKRERTIQRGRLLYAMTGGKHDKKNELTNYMAEDKT